MSCKVMWSYIRSSWNIIIGKIVDEESNDGLHVNVLIVRNPAHLQLFSMFIGL